MTASAFLYTSHQIELKYATGRVRIRISLGTNFGDNQVVSCRIAGAR